MCSCVNVWRVQYTVILYDRPVLNGDLLTCIALGPAPASCVLESLRERGEGERERERERERDRERERERDRETERETERQTERQKNRETERGREKESLTHSVYPFSLVVCPNELPQNYRSLLLTHAPYTLFSRTHTAVLLPCTKS